MTHSGDSMPPEKFDVRFLKSLYEDLNESYERQAQSLASIDKTVASMEVVLKGFETKNKEQDTRLNDHSKRIHDVEMSNASNDSQSQVRNLWHHVKRLNAFMDMKKDSDGIDTRMINIHAQRMQHAVDIATFTDPTSFKVALLKILPWVIITLIVAIILTTLLTFQVVTGQKVIPDIRKIENLE